jgi:hypothetical protein
VANWLNIAARGDLVGSWLSPAVAAGKDLQVSHFGGDESDGEWALAREAVYHAKALGHAGIIAVLRRYLRGDSPGAGAPQAYHAKGV